MNYEHELEVAVELAHDAGGIMRAYMYGDQQKVVKSDGTPLTIADGLINDLVIEKLSIEFPDDGVIGEERSTADYGTGRRWICDPIDGTKAFTWGVPTAMFSLALVIDGRPVLGVCFEPMLERMYMAVAGNGASLNGAELHVNGDTLGLGILAITSAPGEIKNDRVVGRLIDEASATAVFSGAVYKASAVADGRFIGYVEHKVNAYDIAAIEVIVTEAGGTVTGLDGMLHDYTRPLKGVIVSNGVVHDRLVQIVKGED